MLREGFYRVQFSAADCGVGIVAVESGHVRGGDGQYLYSGKIDIDGQAVSTRLKIKSIDPQAPSVFGTLGDFALPLAGQVTEAGFALAGQPVESGTQAISVIGTFLCTLDLDT